MIGRPRRSTQSRSSAASDVYKKQVEVTVSGLDVGTAEFSYSTDAGTTGSAWQPAACTGSYGTTAPQVISASPPFGRDSAAPDQNQVRFRIRDLAGNVGESPAYAVRIDTVPPQNPSTWDCPTHPESIWKSLDRVSCNWAGATDAGSGVAGYNVDWSISPTAVPPAVLEITSEQAESGPLNDGGDWYFHVRAIDQAGVKRARVQGVGVGIPGPVDPSQGRVVRCVNLGPSWDGFALQEALERLLNMNVTIDNDVNVGAVGEHRFGAGRGTESMVYLTVRTGIGGGVIERGRLVLGARGWATELGHIVVEPEGPRCGCGGYGCLEALASGPAIARQARERIQAGAQSTLVDLTAGRLERLSAKDVVTAARSQDEVACQVMERAAYYLGIGLVSIITTFDPEKVVIGGGVSNAGELLLGPARAVLERRAMTPEWRAMPLELAALGEDVGVLGAAALAFGETESRTARA